MQTVLEVVKIHQHEKFQAIVSMHSPANARKPLRTNGRTDGRTDMPQSGHGWSDWPTDSCTSGKRVFRASDRRRDGQPENLMHLATQGGGIKARCYFISAYLCTLSAVGYWYNAKYTRPVNHWYCRANLCSTTRARETFPNVSELSTSEELMNMYFYSTDIVIFDIPYIPSTMYSRIHRHKRWIFINNQSVGPFAFLWKEHPN